ncbi:MAG: branched-chain amino acid ABC transporter permease, partial [Treponema sp.]|nr:branched-chain amino acid ABC transporter permease [Treponema sp.]
MAETKEKYGGIFFKIETFISQKRCFFYAGILLFLAVFPLFGFSRYIMRISIVVGIYSILTLALNLVAGYTGQLSMGNAGFYAIGAYTSTVLMIHFGASFWITIIAGAILAGFCGFLLGLPTMRLKGSYLTIVTLGFGEIIRMILQNWDPVTNGTLGIRNIPLPVFFGIKLSFANHGLYYLVWILALLV